LTHRLPTFFVFVSENVGKIQKSLGTEQNTSIQPQKTSVKKQKTSVKNMPKGIDLCQNPPFDTLTDVFRKRWPSLSRKHDF